MFSRPPVALAAFTLANRTQIKRLLRTSLISLSCTLLGGLGISWGKAPEVTFPGSSGPAQNPNTVSSDEKGGVLERWKLCAELIHPEGGNSASDLQAIVVRPQNVQQMLHNLKLAQEKDLLIEPNFYDEQTLLKFFNASKVTMKELFPNAPTKGIVVIAEDIESSIFPKMTAVIQHSCWLRESKRPGDRVEKEAYVGGNLRIFGRPIPEMTLRVLRSVLGPEVENTIDTGTTMDGPDVTPMSQGGVRYFDRAKWQLAGGEVGLSFNFTLRPPQKPGEPLAKQIVDDDVVMTIGIVDRRQRILER